MSNSKSQSEATSSTELKEFAASISAMDGLDAIAVTKESLRKEGPIMLKVFGETSEETISNELKVEIAGEERPLIMQLESWGTGSPFEVPVYIEDELAVEDGVEFLEEYAQNPTEANLYKLAASGDE